jgi:glycosyltransferase involved in cell wall biosynthesis
MIPELLGADLSQPMWREKLQAIQSASAFVCVSQRTADDLKRFHPEIPVERISVAHNGVSFRRPADEKITDFQAKHGIDKPYFLISGARSSYKNTIQFFQAFAQFNGHRRDYGIVCTGPGEELAPEYAELLGGASIHLLNLPDDELECAYAGAIALVYPSLYEGFGMPIVEAMACGCPVITTPNGPLPEVAGDAAIYVAPQDIDDTHRALKLAQDPDIRGNLIDKGLARATRFTWQNMAQEMAKVMGAFLG